MLKRRDNFLANRCYLCKADEETCDHILLFCPVTHSLWMAVISMMWVSWVMAGNVCKELWAWTGFCKKKHLFFIPLTIFWIVWKERNTRVFEGIETDFVNINDR